MQLEIRTVEEALTCMTGNSALNLITILDQSIRYHELCLWKKNREGGAGGKEKRHQLVSEPMCDFYELLVSLKGMCNERFRILCGGAEAIHKGMQLP